MENGPIFEWSPGNIILDKQEDEEYFDNLINDLQHQHNDDEDRGYVQEDYDADDDRLGSWDAEYVSMEKEESVIVTYDDISEGGI